MASAVYVWRLISKVLPASRSSLLRRAAAAAMNVLSQWCLCGSQHRVACACLTRRLRAHWWAWVFLGRLHSSATVAGGDSNDASSECVSPTSAKQVVWR